MNKFISIILPFILFISINAFSQNKSIEKIITKYGNQAGFSSVQINDPAKSLSSMNKQNSNELTEVLKGVEMLKILTMDATKAAKDQANSFKDELNNIKTNEGLKDLISVNEGGKQVKIFIKESGQIASDLIIIAHENNESTLIWFNGKLDLDKLKKSTSILKNSFK